MSLQREFFPPFGSPLCRETLIRAKRAGGRKPLDAVVHYERR